AGYSFPMPTSIPDGGISVNISAEARSTSSQKVAATIGVDGDIVKRGPVVASANAPANGSDRDVQTVRLVRGPLGVAIVRLALLDGPRYTYTYTGPGMMPSIECGSEASAASVTVDCLQDDVAYHKRGRPPTEWLRLYETTVLGSGDQVSASADGAVTLVFPNGTHVVLQHSAQIQILSSNSLLLGMGEVQVTAGARGLKLKTPSYTATAKSTGFTAFYDPGSKSGIVSTKAGSVSVDPSGPRLKTAKVGARKEVEVTPKSISKPAKTGRAGARGGVNRLRAFELVAKVVSRYNGPCSARTLHSNGTAITPSGNGWKVVVKLAGGLKGSATWKVRGKAVAATNAVAGKLMAGCAASAQAASAQPRKCGNVRFDQELKPDDKGLFGAFRIRASHATCATARHISTKYVVHPDGVTRKRTPIGSWTCTWRPAPVAQQVYASCRRGSARITFVDKIPNG
ncbi:MAG: hypothetical protein ACJ8J0_16640, partial [Longimicrobiaceae bacterium]